jgi:hypothetical protein
MQVISKAYNQNERSLPYFISVPPSSGVADLKSPPVQSARTSSPWKTASIRSTVLDMFPSDAFWAIQERTEPAWNVLRWRCKVALFG